MDDFNVSYILCFTEPIFPFYRKELLKQIMRLNLLFALLHAESGKVSQHYGCFWNYQKLTHSEM